MNIVHLIDYVHPDSGYEINVLSRLQVKDGHQVTIVTGEPDHAPIVLTRFWDTNDIEGKDARIFKESGVRIVRVPTFAFYSGRALFYPRIFKVIRQQNPDVVYVHCHDSVMGMLFTWIAPFLNYPIVLDSHSVEMSSLHRFRGAFHWFYKFLVAPFVVKRNIPLIRLVDSDYVEKRLGVPLGHTTLLSLGADTDLFRPCLAGRAEAREKYHLPENAFVVLYAGKLDIHKGGRFLADAIQRKLSPKSAKPIVFLIVGSSQGDYAREMEAEFSSSENQIIRLPTQRYADLPSIYQCADLALFPKQCSLSFFDAQACELPVLFEDNEINRERTPYGNAVTFVPGDVEDFRAKLIEMIDMPDERYSAMKLQARKYVADHYDFVPIAKKFTDVLVNARQHFALKSTPSRVVGS